MISSRKIESKSILVIGDIMLDTYYYGDVRRISPEAPVPVFRKQKEKSVLGGAANVAANLVAAMQDVSVMAVVGNDENGRKIRNLLEEKKIHTDFVLSIDRSTTVKTRFLATNNQQVMRLDVEDTDALSDSDSQRMLAVLEKSITSFDLIILSDYLKGMLSYDFTQGVIQLANQHKIPTLLDVKDTHIEKYKGAFLIKPNLNELRMLTQMPAADDDGIIEAARVLREKCDCQFILATCGARGMVLVGDGDPFFVEAYGHEVFDVTGAGDTTIAYLAACIVNGAAMKDAVEIANYAAGIQCSKVGTSSVSWREVFEQLIDKKKVHSYKLLSGASVDTFRQDHDGKKIVFTNGCFDILHIGHIRYMQEAARLGDILVIGLNSDASVKRLKGPSRPVNSEQDRAELLCALGFVDYVVIFEEDTPYDLICKIQPDILVKGGDYSRDNVVGTDIVEARGGKLVLIPFVEGKSTTKIIEKITTTV